MPLHMCIMLSRVWCSSLSIKMERKKKYGEKMFPLVASLIRGFNYKPYFENILKMKSEKKNDVFLVY